MWSATALVALVSGLVLAVGGGASINGSPFQAEDGNLVCTGGNPDWACVTEARKADKDTPGVPGPDDSFGQGTKEDTPVPTVVSGSIPPNKSDLKFFGVYKQAASATSGPFMELYWTRVQEPSGTTNMDFEFNQSSVISANGVTPVRLAGDALIQYDLERGGTRPTLFASRWVTSGPSSQCVANNATPCWGNTTASGLPPRVNLTAAGVATGSINTTAIAAADSDGLGALSARTFGEAEVDLAAFGGGANSCITFGSAYLKSRASNSFPAEVKDFIAPEAINVGNCGSVHIRKITNPVTDPEDVQFGYTKTFATDLATANTFSLGHGQSSDYVNNVLPGAGSVNEDVLPANWQFTSVDCSASGQLRCHGRHQRCTADQLDDRQPVRRRGPARTRTRS